MNRFWIAIGLAAVLLNSATGQEAPSNTGAVKPSGTAPAGPSYVIGLKVLEGKGLIPDEDSPPVTLPAEGSSDPRGDLDQTDKANSDPWTALPKLPGVKILAEPVISLVPNRLGAVRVESQQAFSYLEPLGKGRFEAKRSSEHALGLVFQIELKPVPEEDEWVDVSALEIQCTTLDGREPLEGLQDLEAGKPIIAKRTLSTAVKLKLGTTRVIPIPSGPKMEAVLLLRVFRQGLDAEAKE